jgi:hypothetical protein
MSFTIHKSERKSQMQCDMPVSWGYLAGFCYSAVEVFAPVRWQILFSDAVCAFARLSSPPPNATVRTVGLRLASRVVTALFSTPTDGSRVSALVWLLGNAFGKAFCGHQSDLSRDHASPGVSFVAYHVLVEATSLQPAALRTAQWQLLVQAIEPHVRPLGCVPFPHAQTRRPE